MPNTFYIRSLIAKLELVVSPYEQKYLVQCYGTASVRPEFSSVYSTLDK